MVMLDRRRQGVGGAPAFAAADRTTSDVIPGSGQNSGRRAPVVDIAVVGAGIVGLATAWSLLRLWPTLRVVVLDREREVAAHQTGHNSGVIHAGIYYEPGSLKARLCVRGASQLYEYCERHGIPVDRCGKLIVAADQTQLARLDDLEARGRANGVPGLRRIAGPEIADLEPHCVGVAALYSPMTGVVDFRRVARQLADDVRASGAEILLDHEVRDVAHVDGGVRLVHAGGATDARHAIFCAGAWADRLAVASGAASDPRIVPFRAQYLKLRGGARAFVRGLIYPVPDPRLPFLGVHLTRQISGEVILGPTALLSGSRVAAPIHRIRVKDVASSLTWPGTWRMAARFWRTGITEIGLAASRRAFVKACQRFVPAITTNDVEDAFPGVRAQAIARDGRLVDDFIFSGADATLHVRNAPSPAATSSLAIGGAIAERAGSAFSLG